MSSCVEAVQAGQGGRGQFYAEHVQGTHCSKTIKKCKAVFQQTNKILPHLKFNFLSFFELLPFTENFFLCFRRKTINTNLQKLRDTNLIYASKASSHATLPFPIKNVAMTIERETLKKFFNFSPTFRK